MLSNLSSCVVWNFFSLLVLVVIVVGVVVVVVCYYTHPIMSINNGHQIKQISRFCKVFNLKNILQDQDNQ